MRSVRISGLQFMLVLGVTTLTAALLIRDPLALPAAPPQTLSHIPPPKPKPSLTSRRPHPNRLALPAAQTRRLFHMLQTKPNPSSTVEEGFEKSAEFRRQSWYSACCPLVSCMQRMLFSVSMKDRK